jgi:cytochrome P450
MVASRRVDNADVYDPYDSAAYSREFATYAELRESSPVHLHVRAAPPAAPYQYGAGLAHPTRRFWSVFRQEEVAQVLQDRDHFLSGAGPVADRLEFPGRGGMLVYADRPEHTFQRRIANRAFSPRRVDALGEPIASLCASLIDQIRGWGGADIVAAFAVPLPMTVICELLGIPQQDRDSFRRWSDDAVAGFGANDEATVRRSVDAFNAYDRYVRALITERRAHPLNDCISDLIAAEGEGGRRFDDEELVACIQQLVVAGNETTRAAIAFGVELLCTHPEELDKLRREPDLWASAVEEILRVAPPIRGLFRTMTDECVLAGRTLPGGEKVRAMIASANRDPACWDDAETFRVDRPLEQVRGHLSFGKGVHACLGAPLARAELNIALPMLFDRLPALRLDPERPGHPQANLLHRGWESLHVLWGP